MHQILRFPWVPSHEPGGAIKAWEVRHGLAFELFHSGFGVKEQLPLPGRPASERTQGVRHPSGLWEAPPYWLVVRFPYYILLLS